MLLPDKGIKELNIFDPFVGKQKQDGVISYGNSAYSYDVRFKREYMAPKPGAILDPKNPHLNTSFEQHRASGAVVIPAGSFILVETVEKIKVPVGYQARGVAKSTYARLGLIVNIVDSEAEYEGTLSFALIAPPCNAIVVYPGEGIAAISFMRGESESDETYASKGGKYMNSSGVTLPTIKPVTPESQDFDDEGVSKLGDLTT